MSLEQQLIYFVVLLNPFAQAIALWDLMHKIEWKDFAIVYGKATLLSFGVYFIFLMFGEVLVDHIFQIRLSALRIFGGLIMVSLAYRNISLGVKSNLLLNAKISDLAQEISLPYIIGPATLWLCILIGKQKEWVLGAAGVAGLMLANWILLIGAHYLFSNLKKTGETLAGKYLSVLMRTTSLFIGAIGADMIISGIKEALL